MRLTTRTNLAMRVLMACGVNEGETIRTPDIAARCNASVNHLLQVVNLLQEFGYVETLRGRNGGLRLARRPVDVVIGDVFRLFESGTPFAECFDADKNTCPLHSCCRLRNVISTALEAFYHELDLITLQDLVKGNCGLQTLLDLSAQLATNCSRSGDRVGFVASPQS